MMISHYLFQPISTSFMSFRHMHVSSCVVICRNVSKSNFATDGAPYNAMRVVSHRNHASIPVSWIHFLERYAAYT